MHLNSIAYHEKAAICITGLVLSVRKSVMDMKMQGYCDNGQRIYRFHNVSALSISEASYPLQIQSFYILDHSSSGWERNHMFEFLDYEEGMIHFFCESFEVY